MQDFNENMVERLTPGKFLVVDEIMSMWLGKDGKYSVEGLPHVTKITRKPEGVGAEMKASADGSTGCILRLDLMEGRIRMALAEYVGRYSHGTAVCLRLCRPYQGSGRIVIGDSAFASVSTLMALKLELGLNFMGCVKSAHTQYPMPYIKAWHAQRVADAERRGGWITLTSEYTALGFAAGPLYPMWAVGWHDTMVKAFISNVGTTLAADTPSIRY